MHTQDRPLIGVYDKARRQHMPLRRAFTRMWRGGAALLLLFAVVVAAYWAPDRSVDELKVRWAPPPSQFVAIDGMSVHLRDEGPRDDPHPLLLLHGTSSSLHTWEGWTSMLRARHRVISIDLPGYGLTGPFPDGDYRLSHYARFIGRVLDDRNVQRVVLVGNSFGGQVALETALAQPERVERLILVDALGYPPDPDSVPIGFRVARMPVLNRLMRFVLPRRLVEDSVRNVYGNPGKVTPALVDRYYDLTLRTGNRASLPERFKHPPTVDSARRIATIRQPTLILWGGRDRLIPPANAARFRRDIAGSRLQLFPALGHVPQEEDPAATVAVVVAFLER
jgi:pimeloyl-ACP methyl ester carboxylesterase